MRYTPDHLTQADGSPCQWTNCWATVGAWLSDGASGGKKKPTPPEFRRLARVTSCRPGGLGDIERGLRAQGLWGRCKYREDVPRAEVKRLLLGNTRKLVAFETDFEKWPEEDICQPDFNDREDAYHAVGVICSTQKMHPGEVRVEDPLCHRYHWVDVDAVLRAARIYNYEHDEERGTMDFIVVIPPQLAH